MILANPIYDVVFKYLMEDTEIARLLLSQIIGEEIIDIQIQPQESISRSSKFEVIILRLDFKATIKTQTGKKKKVLIELQKGKSSGDIMRFRKYLGENYRKEDADIRNKVEEVPIITIYFLGFKLTKVFTPVMKVNREYIDLITSKKIEAQEEFIEKLTHDSYIIQIPRLKKKVRNELERILKVFNQSYIVDDSKTLQIDEKDIEENSLLQLMAQRLRRAATEEVLLRKIDIEKEVESIIEQHIRDKQILAEQNDELAEHNDELRDENEILREQIEYLKNQLKDQ